MLSDLVIRNRSYRTFDEKRPIPRETILALIDVARRCGSGKNLQPLRYRVLTEAEDLEKMLCNCRFGGALPDVKLPPEGGKPTGFVLIFTDTEVKSPDTLALKDVGIAAQTILLGAAEAGFGGCMLGSFNAARLNEDFGIPVRYRPELVIALGKPAETVMLTDERDGSLCYYRDAAGVHYVPKRAMEDVLI